MDDSILPLGPFLAKGRFEEGGAGNRRLVYDVFGSILVFSGDDLECLVEVKNHLLDFIGSR